MSLHMGRDMETITPRVVALETTTMEENSTPANLTTAILVATEVMVALFLTKANIPPTRILTLDVMRGVAMVTARSITGSILRVTTTPTVAIWVMASTEADIMVQSIMVEATMSEVPLTTTTTDMAVTQGVTANLEETLIVAIDLGVACEKRLG